MAAPPYKSHLKHVDVFHENGLHNYHLEILLGLELPPISKNFPFVEEIPHLQKCDRKSAVLETRLDVAGSVL